MGITCTSPNSPDQVPGHRAYERIERDEAPIEQTLLSYPRPMPPKPNDKDLIVDDRWFKVNDVVHYQTSDQFETMSDVTSILEPETIEPNMNDLRDIDQHINQAPPDLLDSFEKLFDYIKKHIEDRPCRNILIARAIVKWIAQQSLTGHRYWTASRDSPRGLIKLLKKRRMKYSTCFAILCRKAGLQCVIINGLAKTADYEPGDRYAYQVSWNAVYVETGWHIVHPLWMCRPVSNDKLKYWLKTEEDDPFDRIEVNSFQERYFMPKPQDFVYECWSYETPWQLLKEEAIISSAEKFLDEPYLFPPFFSTGLELKSKHSCVLHSKNGICIIEFKIPPAKANKLLLRYELLQKEHFTYKKASKMSKMVFNSRTFQTFIFEVRFLEAGDYKLVIYGGPHQYPSLRLCEFKLICTDVPSCQRLLPLECPLIGWGPGPYSRDAGLVIPSEFNGLIPVTKGNRVTMVFYLNREDREYSVRPSKTECPPTIKCDRNMKGKLKIDVTIPQDGEYGLSICRTAMSDAGGIEETAVCNYLLSTFVRRTGINKAIINNTRKKLTEAYSSDDENLKEKIDTIKGYIETCDNGRKTFLPAMEEDLFVAKVIVDFLNTKNELKNCKKLRQLDKTKKILRFAEKFLYRKALEADIEEANTVKTELAALGGFSARNATLREALAEIAQMYSPPEIIANTVKALLLFLGEIQANSGWRDIFPKLNGLRNFTLILKKMEDLDNLQSTQEMIQHAETVLGMINQDEVRMASFHAHTLYIWTRSVIDGRRSSV